MTLASIDAEIEKAQKRLEELEQKRKEFSNPHILLVKVKKMVHSCKVMEIEPPKVFDGHECGGWSLDKYTENAELINRMYDAMREEMEDAINQISHQETTVDW